MPAPITPSLTVDVIIELADRPDRPIVLIERRNPPLGWALPGGFVDIGETTEEAAIREVCEETALTVRLRALLGCYSDPARDPRGHSVSVVYVGEAEGQPQAQDDARDVGVYSLANLPQPLAFDHAEILTHYAVFLRTGRVPIPTSPKRR